MKKSIITVLAGLMMSLTSFAAVQHDYECIAAKMQAYNSDIYFGLTREDIDSALIDSTDYGHALAVQSAKTCDLAQNLDKSCDLKVEAQVIGQITSLHETQNEFSQKIESRIKIGRFSSFQQNGLCPLNEQLAESAVIKVTSDSSLKMNQTVSGVLVYDISKDEFSLK